MTGVFKLIEANGLTLHGDIEHFAELVRADERKRFRIDDLEMLLKVRAEQIVSLQDEIRNLTGEA